MQNLIRYNQVDDAFDNLFRGILMRPVRFENGTDLQIKLDVSENDKSYNVHAEIPGVNKDDIHITIDGNQVAISAEVKKEKEITEGDKVLRNERYYGKVSRVFTLAQDVDDQTSEAKYNNGVLELVLQKKASVKSKRLTVN
ncbi:HSP20 family protein [Oxalobacteraceae bacterium GrIS 2.11]